MSHNDYNSPDAKRARLLARIADRKAREARGDFSTLNAHGVPLTGLTGGYFAPRS